MRREITFILLVLYWLVLFGLVAPYLVSLPNTEAVILGFALLIVSGYATYRYIRSILPKRNNNEEAPDVPGAADGRDDHDGVPPQGPGR